MTSFSYEEAFSRNTGWVTAGEQQVLRGKRAAIAGMGGVGGSHLITLTRLGIGSFNIADFDQFELANFNRQAGARMSSVGRSKATVLAEMARDINPELKLNIFDEGVTDEKLNDFLKDVDVYIDGLDFFVLDVRRKVFARCRELGIPAVTAAPAGMGSAYLIFTKDGMGFEDYFQMGDLSKNEQMIRFLVGLTPAGLHRSYLVDRTRFDIVGQRVPSTGLACELCAGVVGAQVLKLLLNRGPVYPAPWYHHYDAYMNKWKRGRLKGGNKALFQRLKISLASRQISSIINAKKPDADIKYDREIEAILDLARWAPSGDNAQPWRFEIIDDDHCVVYLKTALARQQPDYYDYDQGMPTLLAGGGLLETIRIAATRYKREMSWKWEGKEDGVYKISVRLMRKDDVKPHYLADCIKSRSVDRRPYRTKPLSAVQRVALGAALGDELTLRWFDGFSDRWGWAVNNAIATDIRLRIPEAFSTHQSVIDWERDFSAEKIPVRAIGLSSLTCKIMRWAMKSWSRVDFMNKYFGGTAMAQLEMGILPGIFCGAHFVVLGKFDMKSAVDDPEFYLRVGQALQKFWLTASSFGLVMQPSFAVQMFAVFAKRDYSFTKIPALLTKAAVLEQRLATKSNIAAEHVVFMGRIGTPKAGVKSRSVRTPLVDLCR